MSIIQNLFYLFFGLISFYQKTFRKIQVFLRNAFNNFIEDKNDFNKAFDNIQRFSKITLLCISRDISEHFTKFWSRTRIFWVIFLRVVTIIHTLRFGVSALLNKQSVREYLFDVGYMVGPPRLISTAITALSLAITAIGLTTIYHELTGRLYIYDIGHLINTKQIKYPLKSKNGRKFNIRSNILFGFSASNWICGLGIIFINISLHFYVYALLISRRKVLFIHKIYYM